MVLCPVFRLDHGIKKFAFKWVFFASQKFFLGDHSSLIVQYGTVLLNTSFMMPVSGININIQLRVSEEDKAGDEQKAGYVCYKMLIHTTKYVLN